MSAGTQVSPLADDIILYTKIEDYEARKAFVGSQMRSNTAAMPCPPPMHIVTRA